MSIILRNTKNMFSKDQKVVGDKFLERWSEINWDMPVSKNRKSATEDDYRVNYKAVYK